MTEPTFEYEGVRRAVYGDGMMFVPVCPTCGRFVKADESVTVNGFEEYIGKQNATCSKCGRVDMPFEGYL
jgi:hypothetical protein